MRVKWLTPPSTPVPSEREADGLSAAIAAALVVITQRLTQERKA